MWKNNPLIQLCRTRFPIIQAPMAGIATTRLIAAVSNAGGLGSLGAAYMTPDEIRAAIREIKAFTDAPFAVNLFALTPSAPDFKQIEKAKESLAPYCQELKIPSQPMKFSLPVFAEQVEVIIEEKVPVFSFTLGIPSPIQIERLKREGIIVMGTGTTLEEALLLEKSGVDAIIAQGIEAGGHRGSFTSSDTHLTLMTLLSQLQSIKIPLIAAGGIMNGKGIAAAMVLGASAVQMGTAFIACPESGASHHYKNAILHTPQTNTTLTSVLTGKAARFLQNRLIADLEEKPSLFASFPYQHYLTKPIRVAAEKQNRPDLMGIYVGQNYALATNLPAAKLISLLVEETAEAIINLQIPMENDE